jgi:hypothetical protein
MQTCAKEILLTCLQPVRTLHEVLQEGQVTATERRADSMWKKVPVLNEKPLLLKYREVSHPNLPCALTRPFHNLILVCLCKVWPRIQTLIVRAPLCMSVPHSAPTTYAGPQICMAKEKYMFTKAGYIGMLVFILWPKSHSIYHQLLSCSKHFSV